MSATSLASSVGARAGFLSSTSRAHPTAARTVLPRHFTRTPSSQRRAITMANRVLNSAVAVEAPTVLFDFDGTLGDTETPAMEVAFWELAPYFPGVKVEDLSEAYMSEFIRENAGKAFEFMVDKCNESRAEAGLPPLEEVRAAKTEDATVLEFVDKARTRFGLETFAMMRNGGTEPEDFLIQQKDDTVLALKTIAESCPGVKETLKGLTDMGLKFAIATTSGKPRVPVSVIAAGLDPWFSPEKIHSGESDFDPPRFKPDPSVYLLAAESEVLRVPPTQQGYASHWSCKLCNLSTACDTDHDTYCVMACQVWVNGVAVGYTSWVQWALQHMGGYVNHWCDFVICHCVHIIRP